jgi:hypothetical protein
LAVDIDPYPPLKDLLAAKSRPSRFPRYSRSVIGPEATPHEHASGHAKEAPVFDPVKDVIGLEYVCATNENHMSLR